MSTVGLTEDQRTTLALISGHGEAVVVHPRVYAALARKGLVVGRDVTPRGHAALAAPRITKKAYEWLSGIEACEDVGPSGHAYSMYDNGWWQWSGTFRQLTPAGRTALNNVRAAMPGEWKELS